MCTFHFDTNRKADKPQKCVFFKTIRAYAKNILDWFQSVLYIKYGKIFEKVWEASAYKRASAELTTVTSVRHHYLKHF